MVNQILVKLLISIGMEIPKNSGSNKSAQKSVHVLRDWQANKVYHVSFQMVLVGSSATS